VGEMNNLVSAYFQRLWKNKLFIGLLIFMASSAILIPVMAHQEILTYGKSYTLESRFTWHFLIIGFLTAIFCPWFLGTEYSDGTIRNKIIAGNNRIKVYLSALLVCITANVILVAVHQCIIIPLGSLLIAPLKIDILSLVTLIGLSILITITLVCINTLLVLINQNKASSTIICLVTSILMLAVSFYILSVLVSSDMSAADSFTKSIFEFFNILLPTGQIFSLAKMSFENSIQRIVCDILIILFTTTLGVMVFERKNLK
jgi:ABC-type transport system involved in multi-copper enzyme maturation permease subunit